MVTGRTHLPIICRHLEVSEIFIYVPPKMLAVSAKSSMEALPKDGVKPVNENRSNLVVPTKIEQLHDVA